MNTDLEIKELVKEKYSAIAEQSKIRMRPPAAAQLRRVVAMKYIILWPMIIPSWKVTILMQILGWVVVYLLNLQKLKKAIRSLTLAAAPEMIVLLHGA